MYCVANICYVCLEKKGKLISNINNSPVNKDIIHIIGFLPFNLTWLKTKRNLLICEQCCLRLRETYHFLEMCLKHSALLEGYMDKLNTTPISNTDNEAELRVYLNIKHKDTDEVKREIKLENEEIYTFQWQQNIEETEDSLVKEEIICKNELDDKQQYPTDNNSTEIIEETEDVFVYFEDSFVKKDNMLKTGTGNDMKQYAVGNNSTENMNNESDSEIADKDNVHSNNTDGVASEFTCKQVHTSEGALNTTSTKPTTYSKWFSSRTRLKSHTQIHTDEYKYTKCKKCLGSQSHLVQHRQLLTGEKLYECATCKKCFSKHTYLVRHMQVHTGEKSYECTRCKKFFSTQSNLTRHRRTHTGEKPYKCSICTKCFGTHTYLVYHMRTHTGEKPYKCSKCDACFKAKAHLNRHERIHNK